MVFGDLFTLRTIFILKIASEITIIIADQQNNPIFFSDGFAALALIAGGSARQNALLASFQRKPQSL